MGGFQIIMFIYGILIFLYGYYIYKSKHPYIPKLHGKTTKKYCKYVGKTTMLVSISPLMRENHLARICGVREAVAASRYRPVRNHLTYVQKIRMRNI